jgi:hypothetical protein
MSRYFELNGKIYRSYKHPILEYILEKVLAIATSEQSALPDEIPFTYEQIHEAIDALGIKRKSASISNFTLDLTRSRNDWSARVSSWIWEQGYDLDRIPDRDARQWAGRLIKKELRVDPYFNWPSISSDYQYHILNSTPSEIYPYLGNDEGALLSVLDYCDGLSLVLAGKANQVRRVQHPKKWQPGEVDGLYFQKTYTEDILYPVDVKALSTGDTINLVQLQSAYHTIQRHFKNNHQLKIFPLAIEMTHSGMKIALFHPNQTQQLILFRCMEIILNPKIEVWSVKRSKLRGGKESPTR